MKIWNKHYECICHAQTIMAHYEEERGGLKLVDLAFFSNYIDGRMTLWQRIRLLFLFSLRRLGKRIFKPFMGFMQGMWYK